MHDKPTPESNSVGTRVPVTADAPLEALLDNLSRRDPAEAPAAADAVAARLEEELAATSRGPHGVETTPSDA